MKALQLKVKPCFVLADTEMEQGRLLGNLEQQYLSLLNTKLPRWGKMWQKTRTPTTFYSLAISALIYFSLLTHSSLPPTTQRQDLFIAFSLIVLKKMPSAFGFWRYFCWGRKQKASAQQLRSSFIRKSSQSLAVSSLRERVPRASRNQQLLFLRWASANLIWLNQRRAFWMEGSEKSALMISLQLLLFRSALMKTRTTLKERSRSWKMRSSDGFITPPRKSYLRCLGALPKRTTPSLRRYCLRRSKSENLQAASPCRSSLITESLSMKSEIRSMASPAADSEAVFTTSLRCLPTRSMYPSLRPDICLRSSMR